MELADDPNRCHPAKREREIDVWNTENEHALHHLENTIGDTELIHVVGAETAAQA